MIDYYEKHASDRFEFIAFHDKRAESLEQMDAEIEQRGLVDKHWGGRTIPFPILLDSTGETLGRYKVHGFPTHILIDPEGRLVDEVSRHDMFARLEAALARGDR